MKVLVLGGCRTGRMDLTIENEELAETGNLEMEYYETKALGKYSEPFCCSGSPDCRHLFLCDIIFKNIRNSI